MENNMVPMLITNVHEYAKKSMCRHFGVGKNSTLTSDGMVNEKFEWGCYDMMMPIMWCCKRCMNLINAMCYIGN